MKVDYIIVGFGLAGMSFAHQLEKHQKSYVVFEDRSQSSSRVAGGLYNPVILKRFTAAWKASEMMVYTNMYKEIEERIDSSLLQELPILRRFMSVEEQNLWFEACDKPILNNFLSPKLQKNENPFLDIPYHYGEVKHTGRVDIEKALFLLLQILQKEKRLIENSFSYAKLVISNHQLVYENIEATHIVFSEGFGLQNNPFFNYLPLQGNKGEYVIIKAPKLQLTYAAKSSIFIIPLGNDLYKVGATYNNHDKSLTITENARKEIVKKLNYFLKAPYEIIDQVAGIRPTTSDRKPLAGTHPEYKNIHILNGFGSRGVIIGPWAAEKLYGHIEHHRNMHPEINIARFQKKL